MELNTDYVKSVLKTNGYKYTNQRAAVYEVFLEHINSHLTTEEVFKYVSEKDPEIGIATVYRTVQLFQKLGILDHITFGDNITRYEVRASNMGHRHHHLICVNCGKVSEVQIDGLDELEKEIEDRDHFKIIDHNLKFIGYCEDCQENEEKVNEKQQ
ncbi:MAG: Fur family transcriptional regulator [Tissierellia bacterium]|nr:Fur family transcriptional regulator [Tissierellia bacterium]